MTTVRYDESMMYFKNSSDGAVETWIYRALEKEEVRLVLDVTAPCSIDIQMSPPMTVQLWRFYEVSVSIYAFQKFIVSCRSCSLIYMK